MGVDLVVGIPTIDWESSNQSLCIFLSVSPFFVSVSPASLLGLHSLQTKSPGVHHCDLFRSIESVTHAIRLTVFSSFHSTTRMQSTQHAQTHSTENQKPARVVLELKSIPTLPLPKRYPDTAQVSLLPGGLLCLYLAVVWCRRESKASKSVDNWTRTGPERRN